MDSQSRSPLSVRPLTKDYHARAKILRRSPASNHGVGDSQQAFDDSDGFGYVREYRVGTTFEVAAIGFSASGFTDRFFIFVFAPLLERGRSPFSPLLLVVFAPLILLFILGSLAAFIRVSRIYLQTSGGPVVLALKFQLTGTEATLTRFQAIKDAVEQAMEAARKIPAA